MSKAKQTPGPWVHNSETDEIIGSDGELVVNLRDKYCNSYCSEEYFDGNAKLIAAAPNLLAALRMVREELCIGGDYVNAIRVADAAIAKATT